MKLNFHYFFCIYLSALLIKKIVQQNNTKILPLENDFSKSELVAEFLIQCHETDKSDRNK